jgi:hypothetical protein
MGLINNQFLLIFVQVIFPEMFTMRAIVYEL